MIRNIVLDMGNVCCRWDVSYIVQALTSHKDMQQLIKNKVFLSSQWQLLDAGEISLVQAEKEMSENLLENEKQMIHQALYHWHDHFDQCDMMEQYIMHWKEDGYRLFLLSNCSLQFFDYFQNKSIFSHFDGYYISAQHHLLKPDIRIYEDFLCRFQLTAKECLFVDDVEENVIAARKTGMNAMIYDGNPDAVEKILDSI